MRDSKIEETKTKGDCPRSGIQNNQASFSDEESVALPAVSSLSLSADATRAKADDHSVHSTAGDDASQGNAIESTIHHGIVSLPPGAYAIHGPVFPDEESDNHGEGAANNDQEDEIVFEAYVPEPTPEERMQRRVQEMIQSAITLDASAIRKIETETTQSVEHVQIEERVGSSDQRHHLKPFPICVFLSLLLVGAISLGTVLGRSGNNDSHDPPLSVAGIKLSCTDKFPDRYNHAKLLVSKITTAETLANITSPQRRALEWIICQDQISSELFNQKDPLTDILPKQAHGTQFEDGDSGEAQVLRRYALATFFMATSEQGPWEERWNFLSPDKHECGWHQNKTRYNFPFQEYDPVGFVCTVPGPVPWGGAPNLMLDDEVMVIGNMYLNFRIPNNLQGILPPEIGFLSGLTHISLEDQKELHGSIPSTIGDLINLDSISILFAGPDFGGLIPPSLFTISSLQWITWIHNEGVWELPSSAAVSPSNIIAGIQMKHTGLSGTVPAFISELTSLSQLDFMGNDLEGTIPDTFESMASLVYINMYDNILNGTLPQSLRQLSSLDAMVLGKNNFEGSLPAWVGNFSKLRVLDLSYNNFEGPIPTEFSRLSSLEHVSLQYNFNLTGSILAFEPLENLSSLLLYENSFSSTIPTGLFSNPAKPIYADFGHNHFTGKLPTVFSERASNTSYLSIMQNDLDANSVNDMTCEEVPVLIADCSSCSCCNFCCSEDSTDEDDRSCNFDLDFHRLVGLECGVWWLHCFDHYYDPLPSD